MVAVAMTFAVAVANVSTLTSAQVRDKAASNVSLALNYSLDVEKSVGTTAYRTTLVCHLRGANNFEQVIFL